MSAPCSTMANELLRLANAADVDARQRFLARHRNRLPRMVADDAPPGVLGDFRLIREIGRVMPNGADAFTR